jgi:hypothetical protein
MELVLGPIALAYHDLCTMKLTMPTESGLRGLLLGLEVLCLKLLGLKQQDHTLFQVVEPSEVLVMSHMAKNPMAEALGPIGLVDHDFLLVELVTPYGTGNVWHFS